MQSRTVLSCHTARRVVLPRLVPRQRPQTQQTSSCALQVLLDYLPGEEEEPQDDFVDFVDFVEDDDPSASNVLADDSQMDTTTGNESASSASARTWRTWSPASDTDMEAECEAPSLARPSLHWASLLPTEHT